jgi:hypothetical protein
MDHALLYQRRRKNRKMMTTEVFNGNEEPTLEEQRIAAEQDVLSVAKMLYEKEQQIAALTQRVKDLEDLLSSK